MEIGKKVESPSVNLKNNKYSTSNKEKSKDTDFEKLLMDSEKKQQNNKVTKENLTNQDSVNSDKTLNTTLNNNKNPEESTSKEELTSFDLTSNNLYDGQTTSRGTKIVAPGSDMDKNAFLKILATQMSNQDPTQSQDGTEYISQFAQFASMEQMSNLNDTMSQFASQSLIGKGVMLKAYDNSGKPITGIVKSVTQKGSNLLVGVEYLNEKGEATFEEFKKSDITNVVESNNDNLEYINNNMSMLVASSMINKDVEFLVNSNSESENSTPIYETLNGIVESVVVENNMVKLNIRHEDSNDIKSVTLDKITKVEGKEYVNKF